MSTKISVRSACKTDIPAMVELWKEMMDFHKERDQLFTRTATGHKNWIKFIAGHMESESSRVLVAECDGLLVGHCLAFIEEYPPVVTANRYGKFQEIVVAADYRRCGVGERLVKKMLKWFAEQGMKRIEVRVSVYNKLSTAFWRKMGFTPYIETLFLEI
jgi:GNAT superfamily N-acetyltransferase